MYLFQDSLRLRKWYPPHVFIEKRLESKQWRHAMTQQPITPTMMRRFLPTRYIQQHTEPCIQQHVHNTPSNVSYQNDVPNNSQTTYHTTYQTPNNNQPAGLPDDLPKDLSNLSNNMTNRTACNHTTINHLGLRKVVTISKKVANNAVSRELAL